MDATEAKKCLKLICKTFGLEVKTQETWPETYEEFVGFTKPKLKPMRKPISFIARLIVKNYPQSILDDTRDLLVDDFIYANENLLAMLHGAGQSFDKALLALCNDMSNRQLYFNDPNKVREYMQKHTNKSFVFENVRTKIGEVPKFSSFEELKMKLALKGYN